LNPEEKLLAELSDAIGIVREELTKEGFDLARLKTASGFEKLKSLMDVKELINANDETRKRFEISARAVFRKYKSCLTFQTVEDFKADYQAIRFIYASLEEDKQKADTTAIIQRLNEIVSEAIDIQTDGEDDRVFDISKVNFEVLRKEFAKSDRKASDVQDLRTVIQKRLEKMLLENPSLGDFQDRFDEIVVEYNKEKDRNTIEATFEALMRLTAEMEEEAQSHVALGLTPEQKPIFDLLTQDDLSKEEIKQIKAVSVGLLQAVRKRIEEVQDVFSKQSTRDGLHQEIYDLLYDERTGLPASKYDNAALAERTALVFNFFERRAQHAMAA